MSVSGSNRPGSRARNPMVSVRGSLAGLRPPLGSVSRRPFVVLVRTRQEEPPTVSVFVALLAGIVLDIAVLLAVGQAIGVLPTVLLLLLGAVLGVMLIRREGRRTLAAFGDAV